MLFFVLFKNFKSRRRRLKPSLLWLRCTASFVNHVFFLVSINKYWICNSVDATKSIANIYWAEKLQWKLDKLYIKIDISTVMELLKKNEYWYQSFYQILVQYPQKALTSNRFFDLKLKCFSSCEAKAFNFQV